jgi:hypothetical protein
MSHSDLEVEMELAGINERGADGLTLREAVARRTLMGLETLIAAHKRGELDFDATLLALRTLVETTMPFVDPSTKHLINQVIRKWDDEAEERRAAARELARSATPRFGTYA